MLDQVTLQTFAPLVGGAFEVAYAPDQSLSLTLHEAVSLEKEPSPDRREAFSLLFSGPSDPILPQAIHRLRHAELGEIELFMAPVVSGQEQLYEVIFN